MSIDHATDLRLAILFKGGKVLAKSRFPGALPELPMWVDVANNIVPLSRFELVAEITGGDTAFVVVTEWTGPPDAGCGLVAMAVVEFQVLRPELSDTIGDAFLGSAS